MTTVEVFAPAKINLTLHVTGKRADGYHLLQSLVVFADVGDRLRVASSKAMELSVSGPFREGVPEDDRNLVWQAVAASGATAKVALEKYLPSAAGIGGGSSDAAAALRTASMLGYEVSADQALKLGADVPMCLSPQPQMAQGIGEDLMPVELPALHAVLVNPGVEVPTGPVFAKLFNTDNLPHAAPPQGSSAGSLIAWLETCRNDLAGAARLLVPEISHVLEALASCQGCGLARMSGSGATCFGLFETPSDAQAAAQRLSAAYPDWWVVPTQLGDQRQLAAPVEIS